MFKIGDYVIARDSRYSITNNKCKYPFKVVSLNPNIAIPECDIGIILDPREKNTTNTIFPVLSEHFRKVDLSIFNNLGD